MLCPHCSKEVPDGSGFCLHCGKSTKPKGTKKVSTGTLVLAVVLTAALTIGASFFVFKRKSDSSSATPGDSSSTQLSSTAKPNAALPPHEFTTEELFKLASPGVVLIEVFNESGERSGVGSGFIAAANGTIVTNYHVVRGAYTAKVHCQDGGTSTVQGVLGYDPDHDVAVIRVGDTSIKPLGLGDSEQLQVGNKVVAIGSPLGFQNTISDGLVSGIRNGLIQTSTPISPGSSGGPFFNTHGEVVGVAVASVTPAENLNFAVPINWAKRYLQNAVLTPLADVSKQNTVVHQLLDSTITVAAGQRHAVPLIVDHNRMSNPELDGSFHSSGGLGGQVRVLVVQENGVVYDSGRTTNGNVHMQLKQGVYQVVIDNTGSMMFARNVTADFKLRYVK